MTYGTPKWRPWVLDEAASRPFLERAVEHGINFFDTADMYSRGVSEEVLGRALKEFTTRDQVVIATKAFYPVAAAGPNDRGLSRKHLFDAIDGSLRRLGIDYVDLYQIHRFDSDTPDRGNARALHDIVRGRQGALHRRVEHVRVAVREDALHVRPPRLDAVRRRCRTTTTWSTARRSAR